MARNPTDIQSHRDLVVWQKGMDLAVADYRLTAKFPSEERYGMISQIRRSSASVPANIAEGYGRDSPGTYAQQLRVGQGSLKELETHIELANRVGLARDDDIRPLMMLADEIGKMLRSLIRAVER
jgi:four helix bundle protein